MEQESALDGFGHYLRISRSLSAKTEAAYRQDVSRLLQYLEEYRPELTLEKVDIFLQANHMELHDLMTM